jgi:hypothetical protein
MARSREPGAVADWDPGRRLFALPPTEEKTKRIFDARLESPRSPVDRVSKTIPIR